MVLSQFSNKLGLSRGRPKVLIFGASLGGQTQFDEIKHSHHVVGFLDNNHNKQGSCLKNTPIYSPKEIPHLCFDKIIIASCYHNEIKQQLVRECKVSPDKVFVYHSDVKSYTRILAKVKQRLGQSYFRLILGTRHSSFAITGLWVARRFTRTYDTQQLTPISWLDEDLTPVESTLRSGHQAILYGPNYIGANQSRVAVDLPAIHLSRYRDATILSSSNLVIQDERLCMWRSPVSHDRHCDYAMGHILDHGERFALTIDYSARKIEKGLAVTGSNDVNYYHWMLEVVSKFSYIDQLDDKYADYPVLLSEKAKEIEAISCLINQLNLKRDIVYLESNQYYTVEDLLTVTPPNFVTTNFKGRTEHSVSDSYFTSDSLVFLRNTGLACVRNCLGKSVSHERIFFARKIDKRPYNQDEVWELLKTSGFNAVYLEDMSFVDQVNIIRKARYIVGPTGAAWTNLLFCEPGTEALCWMAEEYGDFSCYSHIAEEMRVNLEYITYRSGAIHSKELYYGEYFIDVHMIQGWLNGKGLSTTQAF